MIRAHRMTADTMGSLRSIYAEFVANAQTRYHMDADPVEFDIVAEAVARGHFHGYWVEDTGQGRIVAFMLYRYEDHRAVEINVLYTAEPEKKTILDRLMRLFIEDIKQNPSWDVVSWAMLGDQEAFIRTVTWYGFKPVGQAILKFDLMDMISIQILKKQELPPLPEGIRIDTWQPQYAGGVARCIHESFADSADAKWDPRFRTEPGAKSVVAMIANNVMGAHRVNCTAVALKDEIPVGFCFLIQTDMKTGNLPLIGVSPSVKKIGLGNHLLKAMIENAIDQILAGKMGMTEITTTMDTDNIPAIKMYRRMGFREDYNYPHVYLTREKAQSLVWGQWC